MRRSFHPIDRLLASLVLILAAAVLLGLEWELRSPAVAAIPANTLPTARVRRPDLQRRPPPARSPAHVPAQLPSPAGLTAGAPGIRRSGSAAPATPVPHSGGAPPQPGSPAVPASEAPLSAPPPILMYHYIRTVDRQADPLGYNLSVAPALFAAQMAWLHSAGFTGITIDRMLACLRGAARCPLHPIVLTFDDGYQDAYDQALPLLRRYGFTATFYIISGRVGQPGYLSWDELVAMHNAGMEIGSHTIDHFDLTALAPLEARRQIGGSKATLEQRLGFPVTDFCYPSGRYNQAVEAQVRAAGYQSATTTRWDDNYNDLFALPRRRVAGGTSVKALMAIVAWPHRPVRPAVARRWHTPLGDGQQRAGVGRRQAP